MQVSGDRRVQSLSSWAGVVAFVGLLITFGTGAIAMGRRDEVINGKVDKETYERDIGQIKGDIRVIRGALCQSNRAACQ